MTIDRNDPICCHTAQVTTNRIISMYCHNTQGAKASTYTNAVNTCLGSLGSVTADWIVAFYCLIDQRAKTRITTALVYVLALTPWAL
jgi:hypothetical protein